MKRLSSSLCVSPGEPGKYVSEARAPTTSHMSSRRAKSGDEFQFFCDPFRKMVSDTSGGHDFGITRTVKAFFSPKYFAAMRWISLVVMPAMMPGSFWK